MPRISYTVELTSEAGRLALRFEKSRMTVANRRELANYMNARAALIPIPGRYLTAEAERRKRERARLGHNHHDRLASQFRLWRGSGKCPCCGQVDPRRAILTKDGKAKLERMRDFVVMQKAKRFALAYAGLKHHKLPG